MHHSKTVSAFVLACFVALPAHAYVDPGTGSMAIQVIIGGLVAAAFMIKTYYYELKRRIARLFGRETGHETDGEPAGADIQASEESSKNLK